jgi:hypothetical protein
MIRRSAAVLAALVAVCTLSATNVQATLIDSFDKGVQTLMTSPDQTYNLSQANVGVSAAIGAYRNLAIQWVSGRESYADVFAGPTLTGLSFTQGTGEAIATVTWDGPDTPNVLDYALNADLATGNQNEFVFDFAGVTGSGVNLTLTVFTNDAAHSSTYTHLMPAGTSGTFAVPYTSFSGSATWADIDAIVLTLNGTGHAGSDLSLNSIKTDDKAPGVPEPSTLAMTMIGAMVLLGAGRRWRKA